MEPQLLRSANPGHSIPPFRTDWWKVAGSTTAIGAAGAAHAGTVQIELTNNQISHSLGNTVFSDLTGDGVDDLKSVTANASSNTTTYVAFLKAKSQNDGVFSASARFSSPNKYSAYIFGFPGTSTTAPTNVRELVPIAFTDSRINGGAQTNGLLDIRCENLDRADHQVILIRLIFDDANTAEPTDVDVRDPEAHWVDPTPALQAARAAEIAGLNRKLKALKKKLRKAKRSGNRNRLAKARRQIRTVRKQLRSL